MFSSGLKSFGVWTISLTWCNTIEEIQLFLLSRTERKRMKNDNLIIHTPSSSSSMLPHQETIIILWEMMVAVLHSLWMDIPQCFPPVSDVLFFSQPLKWKEKPLSLSLNPVHVMQMWPKGCSLSHGRDWTPVMNQTLMTDMTDMILFQETNGVSWLR